MSVQAENLAGLLLRLCCEEPALGAVEEVRLVVVWGVGPRPCDGARPAVDDNQPEQGFDRAAVFAARLFHGSFGISHKGSRGGRVVCGALGFESATFANVHHPGASFD